MIAAQVSGWAVRTPAKRPSDALRKVEHPVPRPVGAEVLVAISACGVCRTDLHLAQDDLSPRRPG